MNPEEMDEKQLLREILKWTRFAGMNQVKTVLETQLATEMDKLLYQKSDGTRGLVELGKLVGIGKTAINNRWDSWVTMGLGERISIRGGSRFKRSFDLEKFGINVPENLGTVKEEVT